MNNKFRGKRIDNGEWIYGNLIYSEDAEVDEDFVTLIIPQKDSNCFTDGSNDLSFECWYKVIPKTVGQYTGRKNKDGKEIYDGDICESIDGIFLVTWNEEKSAFIMVFQDGERLYLEEMWEDTKIIGNINDTPELIKVNNED